MALQDKDLQVYTISMLKLKNCMLKFKQPLSLVIIYEPASENYVIDYPYLYLLAAAKDIDQLKENVDRQLIFIWEVHVKADIQSIVRGLAANFKTIAHEISFKEADMIEHGSMCFDETEKFPEDKPKPAIDGSYTDIPFTI